MAIKKIVKYGEATLRQPSKEVHKVSQKVKNLVQDMLDTMYVNNDVGLAAPQIGVLKKVIVVRNGDSFVPMINPTIIKRVGTKFLNKEGCLSLDGERTVCRYPSVMVSFTERNGKKQIKTFNGFTSIIIQHETDHLSGKLI